MNQESDHDRAILNELEAMRSDGKVVVDKISELEQERDDHELVSDILSDFPPSRRCYRSVGGVLMERTVAEVMPEIRNEWVKLSKAVKELEAISEEKRRAIEAFKQEHSIRVVRDSIRPME
jgi:prefoldin subunit 2